MKKYLIIISSSILLLFNSCVEPHEKEPKYKLGYREIIPDSNKSKYTKFIVDATSAASLHLSAGDYEDPEDVIEEINDIAINLFTVKTPVLESDKNSDYWNEINPVEMTSRERYIYDSLINQ